MSTQKRKREKKERKERFNLIIVLLLKTGKHSKFSVVPITVPDKNFSMFNVRIMVI